MIRPPEAGSTASFPPEGSSEMSRGMSRGQTWFRDESGADLVSGFFGRGREGVSPLILQPGQPLSDIRPPGQPPGESTRQVRYAVRSTHAQELGQLRVRDRRMPAGEVRHRGPRLM